MAEVAPNGVAYADADAFQALRGRVHWLCEDSLWTICGRKADDFAGTTDLAPASDWPREQWCRRCFPATPTTKTEEQDR